MNASQRAGKQPDPAAPSHALCRGVDYWGLVFEGQESLFKHELGAQYCARLLMGPPREPIHGVALALKARADLGRAATGMEALEQRVMGLDDAEAVRTLWRRQRELEGVLADRHEIEPVKAEALRELEELTERLRASPWLSRHGAERTARSVAAAIWRFYAHLTAAVGADGKPDPVLRAFAAHLQNHLLAPSGRGWNRNRSAAWAPPGCFIYVPPQDVVWSVECGVRSAESGKCGVRSAECGMGKAEAGVQGARFDVQGSTFGRQPAAADYLTRFLCAAFALALFVSGCAGRPLKGGKSVITRKPAGVVEQVLVQSENPAQTTKQDQESIQVRTYTVPAGSRVEHSLAREGERGRDAFHSVPGMAPPPETVRDAVESVPTDREDARLRGHQPSAVFTLSAPMPVVEREEIRARTELGAAQKDTAREVGARLASLKGIVWAGIGLFVFGVASLVWPPLRAVVGSVTTSAAFALGGVALMVLPSLVVGNELLILGVVALAVGGWALAHRHGEMKGRLKAKG